MHRLLLNVLFLIGLLSWSESVLAKCCKLGCCKCGCVAASAEQITPKVNAIAADLNKVLMKHKVAGSVSSFQIVTTADPDAIFAAKPNVLGVSSKYSCTAAGATLTCTSDSVSKK